MTKETDALEQYLSKLEAELEAIGPVESADVIAEIRSHLTEAAADAGGDIEATIEQFDDPEVLAARILEERGILSAGTGSTLPEAPGYAKAMALVFDIAMWLVGVLFLLFFAYIDVGEKPNITVIIIAWTLVTALAAASVWWWTKGRRRPGRRTAGLDIMGLRRISIGGATRIVRIADIPGAKKVSNLGQTIGVALAILLLLSFVNSMPRQNKQMVATWVESAVQESSTGTQIVSSLYRDVTIGVKPGELTGASTSQARSAIKDLVSRRASGKLESYEIGKVELAAWQSGKDRSISPWAVPETTTVFVTVEEFPKGAGGATVPSHYTYEVICKPEPETKYSGGCVYLIKSVKISREDTD